MPTKYFKAYTNKIVCSSEKKPWAKTTDLFSESTPMNNISLKSYLHTRRTHEYVGSTTDDFGVATLAKLLACTWYMQSGYQRLAHHGQSKSIVVSANVTHLFVRQVLS